MKTKGEIAATAAQLVGGDRTASHGDALENHVKIAHIWNAIILASGKYLSAPLTPLDCANMMEGLKIARRYLGAHNIDDYVDGAGYAAVAGEIAEKLAEQARVDQTWVEVDRRGG